ncbi:MAG TPA: hypothetical protein VKB70_06480 [Gaiellaceae bacterium]|nr:hypothetical protein [Gaiellaceae bacterium]
MTGGKDPVVGRALDLLVPEFDLAPDELLFAAHGGAARVRGARRRRRTAVVIAFAALLLFAGAAIAADRAGLLPFMHTNDRDSARFSISPTHVYRGAAPLALSCPGAKNGSFTCHVSGVMAPGNRNYELGENVAKQPPLTRRSMLQSLDKAQAEGADPARVARVRDDLANVGDDFIRALAVLTEIETVGGPGQSNASSGTERVPPRGVPAWVACRELTLATFRCRPLAGRRGVAAGTPLYYLQPSHAWRTITKPPADNPNAFWTELERQLGRKANAAETRFFVDLATVAATSSGGSGSYGPGGQVAVATPDGAAQLVPQSLGVKIGYVGPAVEQPLPRRLPEGLRLGTTRLYRVVFDLTRPDGRDAVGRHTIYVYVAHRGKLGVWDVAWVGTKP